MEQPVWNFEQEPANQPMDETSVNLCAYFDRMEDEKMQQYRPEWTDEQVITWDGQFKDDGTLMILCCERDVEIDEYRSILEKCLAYRTRVRQELTGQTMTE